MKNQPITHLQVLGVRYSDSRFAENDERCVDAYAQSDVYASANVPFTVVEPQMPEEQRIPGTTPAANTDNIGLLGGEIDRRVFDAGLFLQRTLHAAHAGRAGHALYAESNLFAQWIAYRSVGPLMRAVPPCSLLPRSRPRAPARRHRPRPRPVPRRD